MRKGWPATALNARAARMKMPLVKLTAGNAAIVCQWPPTDAQQVGGHMLKRRIMYVTCTHGNLGVENRGRPPTVEQSDDHRYDEESTATRAGWAR